MVHAVGLRDQLFANPPPAGSPQDTYQKGARQQSTELLSSSEGVSRIRPAQPPIWYIARSGCSNPGWSIRCPGCLAATQDRTAARSC